MVPALALAKAAASAQAWSVAIQPQETEIIHATLRIAGNDVEQFEIISQVQKRFFKLDPRESLSWRARTIVDLPSESIGRQQMTSSILPEKSKDHSKKIEGPKKVRAATPIKVKPPKTPTTTTGTTSTQVGKTKST